MSKLKAGFDFLHRNKTRIGATVLAIGGILATWGPKYTNWANLFLALGGLLAGAGAMPSDAQVKAKQDWEKSGQTERRGT